MEDLVLFITQGETEFTPTVLVGVIVFCLILNGLFSLIGNFITGVKR